MCQRVTCSTCGKPSYAGCGRHVEAVLGDVPSESRCKCREQARSAKPTTGNKTGGAFAALWRGLKGEP